MEDIEPPKLDTIRRTHRTLDPYHSMVYFVPEAASAYEAIGVSGAGGYFASRSAALGAVAAEVVAATFFNFNPDLVMSSLEGVWEQATPAQLLEARLSAVDTALRRLLGDEVTSSTEMARAAELARVAAEESVYHLAGRPLFAAHAALDWPEAPHLVLWHSVTLLREFRGDAHVAALLTAGLDGLDSLVIHAASGSLPVAFLKATRGWSDEAWDETVELHRETGWLTDEGVELSEAGTLMREEIEVATDRGAALPWLTIGEAGCTELRDLVRPWSRALSDAMFASFT